MRRSKHFDESITTSSFFRKINFELYQIIRSYFVKLYFKIIKSEQFQLVDLFSYFQPGIFTYPNVIGFDTMDNIMLSDNSLLSIINYENNKYLVSVGFNEERVRVYFIAISGDITTDFKPQELIDIILREAIYYSGYLGKIIKLQYDDYRDEVLFKILPLPKTTLNQIYLRDSDKQELIDFVDAVKTNKVGLRYLLIGEPGTGKTETIRAIISESLKIRSDLTVLIADAGSNISLNTLFSYAEIFKPVLVCIDDIDLLVGSRDSRLHPQNLSTALQVLDGLSTNQDIFLLATTNDKNLVDYALRRPGRFDLILEFGNLEPSFYKELVFRETGNEDLAQLFCDEEITKILTNLRATGAFLVTLVKYLNRERFKQNKYDKDTILKAINKLQQSFRRDSKNKDTIGF
ncbi:MAG: ATP-binding protein [Nanopusillaceae archaeon]